MDDRGRHVPVSRLGLFAIAAVAGLAVLKGRSQARTGLRLLGLWAYLAVVNRGESNLRLAREVCRSCPDGNAVVPYWGYKPSHATEQSLQPTA